MKKILVSALAALAMVVGGLTPPAQAAPTNVSASVTYVGSDDYDVTISFTGDAGIANGDYDIAYAYVTNGTAGTFTTLSPSWQFQATGVQAGVPTTKSFRLNGGYVPNILGSTLRFKVTSVTSASSFDYTGDVYMYSPPANPTVSAAAGSNAGEIVVSWAAVAGLTYDIRYGTTPSQFGTPNTWSAWSAATGSPQTFSGLPSEQTATPLYHVFQVRATDSQSGTATSSTSPVQAAVTVGSVTGLTASANGQSSGGLYVGWSAAANATGYEISYATSDLPLNDLGWSAAATLTGGYSTSKQYTGLNTSSQYWFKVVPIRNGVASSGVKSTSGTTPSTGQQQGGGGGSAPGSIATFTAVHTNVSGQIRLTWTAASNATDYDILRSTSLNGSYASVGLTPTLTRTYVQLDPSIAYFYKIRPYNNATAGTATAAVGPVYADGLGSALGQTVITNVLPVVPVFKQPKFAMPSKIDVDTTGKVSLSGKDMGVSTVLIGGKEQKIDTNSDEKLVFDTTGLAKGVHDLVMKGAFGTYTVQKAIQVGEAVVTKVAAVSARQVGMAGGELSISGVGLEGTTQITMNGQVLEIVSRTDSKVTFKVPASTVASVNSIMIEGSFVPVLFKNAFSYTK